MVRFNKDVMSNIVPFLPFEDQARYGVYTAYNPEVHTWEYLASRGKFGYFDVIQGLVERGHTLRAPKLAELIACGSKRAFEKYLEKNGNLLNNVVVSEDDVNYDFSPLSYAIILCGVGSVKKLLAYGADPNVLDEFGNTPLTSAAECPNSGLTKVLLAAGADPNLRNSEGNTPLSVAIEQDEMSTAIIKLLLEAGADPNAPDRFGDPPLVKVLAYFPPGSPMPKAITPLLKAGADPNLPGASGLSALQIARRDDQKTTVKAFLKALGQR